MYKDINCVRIVNNMLSQDKVEYLELIEGLKNLNSEQNIGDVTQKCLNSLTRLKLARKFSKIDDEIFQLALKKLDSAQTDFFIELLNLETKRLKFKEEISKCPQKQTILNK
jgi:hypothetical protein